MNKKLNLIFITFLLSLFCFSNVLGACVIQGYTKDISGNLVGSFVQGLCVDTGELLNFTKAAGTLWSFAWGGPADTCASRCTSVYINGTNSTYSWVGYADAGYPLNSGNMPGWGTPATKYTNVTIHEVISPIATFGGNPPDGYDTTSTTITFDGKCSDDSGLTSIAIYGNWGGWGAKNTSSSPTNNTFYNLTVSSIPGGTWSWSVYCLDTSSNYDFTDTNRTFTIDTGAPTITINSPSATTYGVQAIWYNVTTSEEANWCGYSLDGASNVTMDGDGYDFNHYDNSVSEGGHTIMFYCNDTLGNMGSNSISFTVDITPPVASLGTNPIDGYTDPDGSIAFELICTDNLGLSSLQLWTNVSGSWAATATNSSPLNNTLWTRTVSGMTDGFYQWGVYCLDNGGNSDRTDTNRTFTVDTGSMTITITSPLATTYYNISEMWFNVTTSEVAGICYYNLDDSGNVTMGTSDSIDWQQYVMAITQAAHSVDFYCNDSANNWYLASRAFYVSGATSGSGSTLGFIILGLFLLVIFFFCIGFFSKSIPLTIFSVIVGGIFLIFTFSIILNTSEIRDDVALHNSVAGGYQGIIYLFMLVVFVILIFAVFSLINWHNYQKKGKMRRWGLLMDDED